MASIGDIVIYTRVAASEGSHCADVPDEIPAIVVEAHTATDCTILAFCYGSDGGGLIHKRCDEDNSAPYAEGTWRPL